MFKQNGCIRLKACIYARVSTVEQEKEGFSIPAQQKLLREYASKCGFSIVREFTDSETAKTTGRTGFNEMLAFIGKKESCRIIIVEKTDRLTRNMTDYLKIDLEKSGIEIHFVREGKVMNRDSSPSDHFIQDIEIAQAAYLSRNISAEAKKGMKAKAEAGYYPSVAPMGYINTEGGNGKRIIVPDPVTAPLVKLMFERYSTGNVSIRTIASEAFSRGLRTKKGNRLSNSTIHKMIRNPIYRGKFLWKSIEYDGNHEALITSSLWFKVQDILSARSVEKPRQTLEFPYTSLMKCGICGCTITAEQKKGKYIYYHCTGFKRNHVVKAIRQEKLDMQFSVLLRNLQIEREIAKHLVSCIKAETQDEYKTLEMIRVRLVSQRQRLRRRSEVLYDDRLDGRIDVIQFDQRSAQNKRKIEEIEEQLDSLVASSNRNPLSTANGIIELVQNAPRLFVIGKARQKKEILQNLLSNCTLSDGSIVPELRHPYGILHDTNVAWKASGAVITDISAVRSYWHPKANLNSAAAPSSSTLPPGKGLHSF